MGLPGRGRARPIDHASSAVGIAIATFGPLTLAAFAVERTTLATKEKTAG